MAVGGQVWTEEDVLDRRVFVVSFLVIFTFLLLNFVSIIYLYQSIIELVYCECLCRPLLVSEKDIIN